MFSLPNPADPVVDSLARMGCVLIELDREAKVSMGSLVRSSNVGGLPGPWRQGSGAAVSCTQGFGPCNVTRRMALSENRKGLCFSKVSLLTDHSVQSLECW